jgi:hypothetical protein
MISYIDVREVVVVYSLNTVGYITCIMALHNNIPEKQNINYCINVCFIFAGASEAKIKQMLIQ